ncbi:MAG: glutamate ligase domain-containing protein, partial [Bacteroidia bacterium]
RQNTGFSGRWQVLGQKPLMICDTAHNVDGLKYVREQIKQNSLKKLHMVIGMVNDKDVSKMLSVLPTDAEYYFCKANIPRAMPANELQEKASAFGLKGRNYDSVRSALNSAKNNAQPDDLIFIGGSTFVVAEII